MLPIVTWRSSVATLSLPANAKDSDLTAQNILTGASALLLLICAKISMHIIFFFLINVQAIESLQSAELKGNCEVAMICIQQMTLRFDANGISSVLNYLFNLFKRPRNNSHETVLLQRQKALNAGHLKRRCVCL